MNKIENFLKGTVNAKDKLAPSHINLTNPKYVEMNGKYYAGLLVVDYNR